MTPKELIEVYKAAYKEAKDVYPINLFAGQPAQVKPVSFLSKARAMLSSDPQKVINNAADRRNISNLRRVQTQRSYYDAVNKARKQRALGLIGIGAFLKHFPVP